MSLLNHIPHANYQGGNSEEERLEAIFDKLLNTHGHGVTTMSALNSSIGLNLERDEEQYFEALLVSNLLVESNQPSNSNYYTIKLSNDGFLTLKKHGSYKRYKLSTLNKEDLYKLILSKLRDVSIKPISSILREIGLDIKLADAYEYELKNKGFIQCSKEGCVLRPAGNSFLHGISDDNFQINEDSSNSKYQAEISVKVDEIIEYLKKAGIEREIIFEEIQELKELSKKLSKKNLRQIVLGKIGDLAIENVVNADTLKYVYKSLIGEDGLLPWQV